MIKLIEGFDYELKGGLFLRWLRADPKLRYHLSASNKVKAELPLMYRWLRFLDWINWRYPAVGDFTRILCAGVGIAALALILAIAVFARMI